MVDEQTFRDLALSFPASAEILHFEKISFKVVKKIFATLNLREKRACVKLSEIDQDVFSAFDRTIVYPVPNKWGKHGWTLIDLTRVRDDILIDMLRSSYYEVAPKRLIELINKLSKC